MSTIGDKINVFAIPDFWQPSKLLDLLPEDVGKDFLDVHPCDELPNTTPTRLRSSPVILEHDGFFKLPTLAAASAESLVERDETSEASFLHDEGEDSFVTDDMWMDIDEPSEKKPSLTTWERFQAGTFALQQSFFLSEAGPATFDDMLSQVENSLMPHDPDEVLVQSRPYLKSLLELALGRASALFSRTQETTAFTTVLPNMRISGYSRAILQSIEKDCLACGKLSVDIQAFVANAYMRKGGRCQIALASAVRQVLCACQQYFTIEQPLPQSLLQLRTIVSSAITIMKPLWTLISNLPQRGSDEEVVSVVFQGASMADDEDQYVRDIMRELLQQVSKPWIELLEEWIGTKSEHGLPFSRCDIGSSKAFVTVGLKSYTDDSGRVVEDIDFHLDRKKVPDFIPEEVAISIFETGRNLRFIRMVHPENPLVQPDVVKLSRPPELRWLYSWDSVECLELSVAQYRDELLAAIVEVRSLKQTDTPPLFDLPNLNSDESNGHQLEVFGVSQDQLNDRLQASMHQLSQPFVDLEKENSLGLIVRRRLSYSADVDLNDGLTPHWSLVPVLSFGSIVATQAHIVNRESLRLLFSKHALMKHLQIQKEFHLFGNGMFCSRLSHALFDSESATAERQAGIALQGGEMGLRLGDRDTWPPASSELRLALMGILSECYVRRDEAGTESIGQQTLPGDLSFAIRDLCPEEIDNCLDADSLEAMDFLRLSYQTPPELKSIITPIALLRLDSVFKLLLRVLRLLYTANELIRNTNFKAARYSDYDNTQYRFVREAHHFVSNIAAYFLDTGIARPWERFQSRLEETQDKLNEVDTMDKMDGATSSSPEQLRGMLSDTLDDVTSNLFLRKRQQAVLTLLEDIFRGILQYAKVARLQTHGRAQSDVDISQVKELYSVFKHKVQTFISACRGLTERLHKEKDLDDMEMATRASRTGDESPVSQLLARLDLNGFYLKH